MLTPLFPKTLPISAASLSCSPLLLLLPLAPLLQTGRYFGYRYPKETYGDTGIRSGIQMWNTPKDTPVLADEYLETDLLKVSAETFAEVAQRASSVQLAAADAVGSNNDPFLSRSLTARRSSRFKSKCTLASSRPSSSSSPFSSSSLRPTFPR
jgi:hypothetical protein